MDLTQAIWALGIPGVAIVCWAVTHVIGDWLEARKAEGELALQLEEARRAESELALKRELVARGMSAEEIVRVLQAGNAAAAHGSVLADQSATKEISELLAENSYSGNDIVKVLQACQGMPVAALAAVKPLIENGYSGDDIVKALKACQPPESVPQRDYEPAPWPATTEIKN